MTHETNKGAKRQILTGFPSIDALAQPNWKRGLSITGNARLDLSSEMMLLWSMQGKRPDLYENDVDQTGRLILVDFKDEEPAEGFIVELRQRYRDRAGLVLIGHHQISDPMFDEISEMTIQFDYVPDETGHIPSDVVRWLVTYLRDGYQATGILVRVSRGEREPRWEERPNSVEQTGIYFAV